jgi:hypothetical protein
MVSGNFTTFTSRDYSKAFFDEFKRFQEMWKAYANQGTMDGAYMKETEGVGLSRLQTMYEGQEIRFQDFLEGNQKEIEPEYFGLGVQITEIAQDDDRTGHLKKGVRELAKAAKYTEELEFWDLLNSGFDSSARTGADGYALFSDSHATLDGDTTIDNNGTAGSLSMSTLQNAITHFRKMKQDRSIPINMQPKVLLIPPDLEWKAKELELSELNPEDANNAINTVRTVGLKYMIIPYLTSTTAYFLLGAKDDHDLRFIRRKPFQFKSYVDFNSGNQLHKVTGRFVCDFVHYRGVYGNAGA